ncbi:MAG TPA: hypothetical protein ENK18_23175 [Deltaproteobacteria bacterium]|nr:hypothetical protein [Deltaproteobacteria bacterium]
MTSLLLLSLTACLQQDETSPPPRIEGLWQVHQVETTSKTVDGQERALEHFPGCGWARQTWSFGEQMIRVGHDVLCPGNSAEESVGCRVSVEVPASWDETAGVWTVTETAKARSRTRGVKSDSLDLPSDCSVEIEAGQYPVVEIRRQSWRWEMSTPAGYVLRLKIPDSDDPDFVIAMRSVRGEESP